MFRPAGDRVERESARGRAARSAARSPARARLRRAPRSPLSSVGIDAEAELPVALRGEQQRRAPRCRPRPRACQPELAGTGATSSAGGWARIRPERAGRDHHREAADRRRAARGRPASRARTMSAASRSDSQAVEPSKVTNEAWPSASSARARSSGAPASSSACAGERDRPLEAGARVGALGGVRERRERGGAQLLGRADAVGRRAVVGDQLDDLVAAPGVGPLDPVARRRGACARGRAAAGSRRRPRRSARA